tara:strand:+ start:2092 stop:2844 length:753 start_codon:yes stop_codon:yes gene_type:complete
MAGVVATGAVKYTAKYLVQQFAFDILKQGVFSTTSYVRDQVLIPYRNYLNKRNSLQREVDNFIYGKDNLISDPVGAIVSLSQFAQGDIYRFTAGAFKQAYDLYLANTQKTPERAPERLYFPAEKVEPINVDQHALQTEKMLDTLDKELGFINEALTNELSFNTQGNRKIIKNAPASKIRTVDAKKQDFRETDVITEEDERFLLFLPFLSQDRNLTEEEFKYVKTMGKLEAFKSALKTDAYLRASAKYRPV